MTKAQIIIIVIAVVLVLGIIIIPLINRRSFRNLPPDQQVRILMKEAKGLVYFKNVSNGNKGVLYYVKNKRKILAFPWILTDGKMLCTRHNPFSNWDYPEEQERMNEDELKQLMEELEKFNKKNPVKIYFK
ncbi:MAG: hypothetical protein NC397_08535 [Clostridium sp.]|nr:hypothetical protein [Clostridium sp.]